MHKINVGISYDHPTKGPLYYAPGDVADLDDWPDLDKLTREGTITAFEDKTEAVTVIAPPEENPPSRRSFRKADKDGE